MVAGRHNLVGDGLEANEALVIYGFGCVLVDSVVGKGNVASQVLLGD